MNFNTQCSWLIAFLACLPNRIGAAPCVGKAYEAFNYGTVVDAGNNASDSNLNANNRGLGWNSTGDAGLSNTTVWGGGVTTAPLVVTNTTVAAGSLASLTQSLGNRIHVNAGTAGRSLGQTVDAGSLYISFTIQRLTDSIRTINFALFAGTAEKLGVGQYATAAVGAPMWTVPSWSPGHRYLPNGSSNRTVTLTPPPGFLRGEWRTMAP